MTPKIWKRKFEKALQFQQISVSIMYVTTCIYKKELD